jgi:hypothetical protein
MWGMGHSTRCGGGGAKRNNSSEGWPLIKYGSRFEYKMSLKIRMIVVGKFNQNFVHSLSILLQATDSMGSITGDNRAGAPRVRRYHLLPLPGTKRGIRIFLDRLQLLNILDQVLLFSLRERSCKLYSPGRPSGLVYSNACRIIFPSVNGYTFVPSEL